MPDANAPDKLAFLHAGEEFLRSQSTDAIRNNARLSLHMEIVESAMDVLHALCEVRTDDQDLKAIQVLSARQFNAYASATALLLKGYAQTSGMILRDILETVFLVDYFGTERVAIARWRAADRSTRLRDFKPVKIREALDARDGFTSKKRAQLYEMFSELAGHPSMAGVLMLGPRGGDLHVGPFFDVTALAAGLDEMGRLAVQSGEVTSVFLPSRENPYAVAFHDAKMRWFAEFRF